MSTFEYSLKEIKIESKFPANMQIFIVCPS